MDARIYLLTDLLQRLGATHDDRLWDVLSALCGPDDNNFQVKDATTAVIRHKLGVPHTVGLIVRVDCPEYVNIRKSLKVWDDPNDRGIKVSSHFLDHAKKAFHALGLKWNELNT